MSPPSGRPPSGPTGAGGDPYRTGMWCGAGFVAVGIALLLVGSGADPIGWLSLIFGLIGVLVCGGALLGWITPRPGDPRRGARRRRRSRTATAADRPERHTPVLSPAGRNRVAGVVATLHAAGVFAPHAPDPTHLYEAVADYGEPVTVDAVLAALHEAGEYHRGFRPEACLLNLVSHGTHTEQDEAALRQQVDDLVTLSAGALVVCEPDIRFADADRARIRMTINGDEHLLDYVAAPKYLSTVIHVELARALRATGTPRRLAWFWSDQEVWITALPDRDLGALNSALDPDVAAGRWEWVDEQPPVAAGS